MWSLLMFGTGVVLWVELLVQRRLCPIFVRDVGSPDIHECFHRLTSSQRTPGMGRHIEKDHMKGVHYSSVVSSLMYA